MRFWISWYQPTEDYRPLHDPPNEQILGWWCSGFRDDDAATICALVSGRNEKQAIDAVQVEWPEAQEWRFIEERPLSWRPGDRFPCDNKWCKLRIESKTA